VQHSQHKRHLGHEVRDPQANLNAEEQDDEDDVHGCATRKQSGYQVLKVNLFKLLNH
jgi:hypothetical protein